MTKYRVRVVMTMASTVLYERRVPPVPDSDHYY